MSMQLPRPKSFMPGPVAPWANIHPDEREIKYDDFVTNLARQESKQILLDEMNDGEQINPSSAVLAPFVLSEDNQFLDSIIVTQRPETMNSYSGHIALPGGHLELEDANLKACALRETFEEIGVHQDDINVIGASTIRRTKSAEVYIAPYVGIVSDLSISKVVLNEAEVEFLHKIKVAELLKPDNYYSEIWDSPETSHLVHIFSVHDVNNRPVFIWGATAQIIFDLLSNNF